MSTREDLKLVLLGGLITVAIIVAAFIALSTYIVYMERLPG